MKQRELSPKLEAMYLAVMELFKEGADINNLTVAEITKKAGIGKGTAYEYVSNKEEIIAGALYNQLLFTCEELQNSIQTKENFSQKIEYMMRYMEEQTENGDCFLQAIHIMSENSPVSKLLYAMTKDREVEDVLLEDVIGNVLKEKAGDRCIKEEKMQYLVLNIISKMFCFGMYLFDRKVSGQSPQVNMCQMICEGICRETEEILTDLESFV